MAKKIDEKALISSLEFAAKAAEEFLRMYNQIKPLINEIKPLTPYQIKKKKHEEWAHNFKINFQLDIERKNKRRQEVIQEIMKANFLSYSEAVSFIQTTKSAKSKEAYEVKKNNERLK